MSDKPIWTKQSAHNYALDHAGRRIELQYEQAGFQSGWAVYAGDRLIDRCAELMQARGLALQFVANGI